MSTRDRHVSEHEIGAALTAVVTSADDARDAFTSLPVPVRLALAAQALATEGKRVSRAGLCDVGRAARSNISRPESAWARLAAALVEHPEGLTRFLLADDCRRNRSPAELERELEKRDTTIAELNARVAQLEASIAPIAEVANAALDVLSEVRGREEAALAKVLALRRT